MVTATPKATSLSGGDTDAAAEAARTLQALLTSGADPVILRTQGDEEIAIPAAAASLVVTVLAHLSTGQGLAVLPTQAEISTQQAADILNVSRPFLVELIDNEELPARRVGTHRRILLSDLLAYKQRDDVARQAVLAKLIAENEALGAYQ